MKIVCVDKMEGVLCENRMSIRLKGRFYKTLVKPTVFQRLEREQENKKKKMSVLLRWKCEVIRKDIIRNKG